MLIADLAVVRICLDLLLLSQNDSWYKFKGLIEMTMIYSTEKNYKI